MSVRRSKFEYILTLGWKNRGMERLSWSKYSWNRAWILNLTHRIFSRERPETKTIWADGGLLWTSLSCWSWKKQSRSAKNWTMMGRTGGEWNKMNFNYNYTHSACNPIRTALRRNRCICRSFNTFSWKLWRWFKFQIGISNALSAEYCYSDLKSNALSTLSAGKCASGLSFNALSTLFAEKCASDLEFNALITLSAEKCHKDSLSKALSTVSAAAKSFNTFSSGGCYSDLTFNALSTLSVGNCENCSL